MTEYINIYTIECADSCASCQEHTLLFFARIMGRSRETVSRYVHEHEAAVNAVRIVIDAQNT